MWILGCGRLETIKVLGRGGGRHFVRHYGRRGPDGNFARGTGTFRSLHGGRIPALNPP